MQYLLSKPRVRVTCLSLRLRYITQTSVLIIHGLMLNPYLDQWESCLVYQPFVSSCRFYGLRATRQNIHYSGVNCALGPSKSIRHSGDFVVAGFVIAGCHCTCPSTSNYERNCSFQDDEMRFCWETF